MYGVMNVIYTNKYSIAYDYTVVYKLGTVDVKTSINGFTVFEMTDPKDLTDKLSTLGKDAIKSQRKDIDIKNVTYIQPYRLVIRQLINTDSV